MIGLTAKQRDLLNFIEDFVAAHEGKAPSFEEMKEALDLKSKSGVHRLIHALEERGFIRRLPNRARALEVFPKGNCKPKPAAVDLTKLNTSLLLQELWRRGYHLSDIAA